MKKIVIGDFTEYNFPTAKLGNYHICNQFVKNGYEALWISNTYNELIFLKDKVDYACKRAISKPHRNILANNVYGFAPWSWRLYGDYPFSRNPRIIQNMPGTIRPDIKKSMAKMDFDKADVLWISNPKLFWLADVIEYGRLAYRIADDYAHFKDFPNIAALEEQFIKKADHIFMTSHLFEEKVRRLGKKPVTLKNAADTEFFAAEQPAPVDYRDKSRKRIVYVGAIRYWFDVELVARLAEKVAADIYLVGTELENLDGIRSRPNVHILGARDFSTVPAYMQHADVAIIPFKTGELTAAISPLKLFEYCAAGTPVVSTYMREVAQLDAPICVARNAEDFISGVQKALDNPKPTDQLQEYAARNSWAERFNTIKEEFYRHD